MSVLREDYSVDDAISKVQEELGFTYISSGEDNQGYFLVSDKVTLNVTFGMDQFDLEEASIKFSDDSIDITKDFSELELYSSSLESCMQIVETIQSLL